MGIVNNVNDNGKHERRSPLYRILSWGKRYDFLQLGVMSLLLATGMLFIYSTGQQVGGSAATSFWHRQLQWLLLGGGAWLLMSLLDYRFIKILAPIIYAAAIALLVAVLLFGIRRYGAVRWLRLGSMRLQPSEFAKLASIIMTALIIGWHKFRVNNFFHLLLPTAVILLPFVLIAVEPDLGSAIILLPILVALIFCAGIKWRYIIICGTAAVLLLGAEIYNEVKEIKPLLRGYQKERILVFLDPERDLNNRGYNQFQARLAVGSGGLTGKGIGHGTQNALGFLPQSVSNNDFIFSVIGEETGFIGSACLITLYILLLYTMLRTAWLASEPFGRFLAVGIATVFFVHSFVNIGMSLGIMPITGLPLPLVSYGGSFLLFTMVSLGMLQSIYIHRESDGRQFSPPAN